MRMDLSEFKSLVADGKFFGVKFVRRSDGEIRHMNARFIPPAPDAKPVYDPDLHNLLVVWDLKKRGYRSIPVDNILELTVRGRRMA